MHICVIGAGVIGCATAYELQRQGHQVTLVDADRGPGLGTSFANGAQLSYSYVEPLASPATLWSLPRLFFGRHSPVRFRLRMDPAQWHWGLRFVAACRASQARHGTHRLLQIAALSRDTLDAWLHEAPLDFGLRRNGKLVLCPDAATLARQAAQVRLQAYAGTPQRLLDRDACLQHEPALADYAGFAGGVWTPSECVGDPHAYCDALVARFTAAGGIARFGTQVRGFVLRQGRAAAVDTAQGRIEADAFVLCAGVRAPALARQLGERLPIYPVKGYSLTLPIRAGRTPPVASVTDLGKKMVLAPLGGSLRVAAMAEVVGDDLAIPPARIASIRAAVEEIYPGLCERTDARPWAGLRPATPTSLPIVRASRIPNAILNLGHGALGFTLAAGTARMVGELVAQRPCEAVLPRFDTSET